MKRRIPTGSEPYQERGGESTLWAGDLAVNDGRLREPTERIGIANDELRDYVLSSNKKNSSEHRHYSTYYTPELAELVASRDRTVIERFNYTFEQTPPIESSWPKPSVEGEPASNRAS